MKNYIEKLIELYKKGLVHIVSSSFINKVLFFIGNAVVVRILTKSDYGAFSYADSLMAFVLAFNSFGVNSGVLQYCSEKREDAEKEAFSVYALKTGVRISIIVSLLCFLFSRFAHFNISESKLIFAVYAFYPISYFLFDYFCVRLRVEKQNKSFALLTNLNALIYVTTNILGCLVFGVIGIPIALYLSTIITAIVGHYKSFGFSTDRTYTLQPNEKKAFVRFSAFTSIGRVMTNMITVIDVFLVGTLISDPEILANYKVATIIPTAMMFLPNSIILFIYPYVAEHRTNYVWLKRKLKTLFAASTGINFFVAAFLIVTAPYIIHIIWGSRYDTAVEAFRLLSVSYFFSATFRFNAINLLIALNRPGVVFLVNTFSGVANVLLDILMIRRYGAIGAAWATLLIVLFTSFVVLFVLLIEMKKVKMLKTDVWSEDSMEF